MGILRSVALGKSRKSAGELTFYNRIGVACFRQKPARSPGYKPTVPQRMQQAVFRFMKANVDKSGVKNFVDQFYDAKPRTGKSETTFNMFYRAFMPHLVASKKAIYELPAEDIVNNSLFMGTPASNNDILTNGILGALELKSASAASITIDAIVLDAIIAKANQQLSTNDVPFTINNLFMGLFGAKTGSDVDYINVPATNVIPTLADGVYTFDTSGLTKDLDLAKKAYVAMLIGGVAEGGSLDITRRRFATDSASFL